MHSPSPNEPGVSRPRQIRALRFPRRQCRTPISPLPGKIVELGELASLAELERGSPPRYGVSVQSRWRWRSSTPLPSPPPQGGREACPDTLALRQTRLPAQGPAFAYPPVSPILQSRC